jgi:hypothetical protein
MEARILSYHAAPLRSALGILKRFSNGHTFAAQPAEPHPFRAGTRGARNAKSCRPSARLRRRRYVRRDGIGQAGQRSSVQAISQKASS